MDFRFFILIGIMLMSQTLAAVTMTEDEILKLDLKKYNKEGCPSNFSVETKKSKYKCSYTFYCRDSICQPSLDEDYFEFTDANGITTKYISSYCNKDDGKCSTELCEKDSDCLSNQCLNGNCVVGQSLFRECSDVNYNFDPDNTFQKIKCGKLDFESCKSDDECAGRCISDKCSSHGDLAPDNKRSDILLYGTLVGSLVALFAVCYFIFKCCRKAVFGDKKVLVFA